MFFLIVADYMTTKKTGSIEPVLIVPKGLEPLLPA